MIATYDPLLVTISVVIAILGSYTGLRLARRLVPKSGLARKALLSGAAVTIGCGIWSMHFVGMLAILAAKRIKTWSHQSSLSQNIFRSLTKLGRRIMPGESGTLGHHSNWRNTLRIAGSDATSLPDSGRLALTPYWRALHVGQNPHARLREATSNKAPDWPVWDPKPRVPSLQRRGVFPSFAPRPDETCRGPAARCRRWLVH
ncbi:MAG TPA: hypothetical protein DEP05_04785 [Betaproteobacteria bacterium]|nr:hypothetical protein [Betaproteobacteria bacterium]